MPLDPEKLLVGVIGLSLALVIVAAVMPGAIQDTNSQTVNINQSVNVTYDVYGSLQGNLTDVTDGSPGSATLVLSDNSTSKSVSLTENQNKTVTFNGYDIGLNSSNYVTDTSAEVTYTVPSTYGWGDGASGMWGIMAMVALLAVIIVFIRLGVGMV